MNHSAAFDYLPNFPQAIPFRKRPSPTPRSRRQVGTVLFERLTRIVSRPRFRKWFMIAATTLQGLVLLLSAWRARSEAWLGLMVSPTDGSGRSFWEPHTLLAREDGLPFVYRYFDPATQGMRTNPTNLVLTVIWSVVVSLATLVALHRRVFTAAPI